MQPRRGMVANARKTQHTLGSVFAKQSVFKL
jgi:hypothetical protein